MAEEIQIQTADEVKNIDYMRTTNEIISNQIDNQLNSLGTLSDALDSVNNTLNLINDSAIETPVDLTEVAESIDNIDTTVIEAQTQDILSTINSQQQQIDNIESNINEINDKINQLLEKI